jgi:hypothetical protein
MTPLTRQRTSRPLLLAVVAGLVIVMLTIITLVAVSPVNAQDQGVTRYCPGSQNSVPIPPGANASQYCSGLGFTGTPDEMPLDCMAADLNASTCAIIGRLETFIMALSALVGVVVVAMVALGGIQYSASRDNPQEAQAAKTRIRNALLALVVYMFAWLILQWLIPGAIL